MYIQNRNINEIIKSIHIKNKKNIFLVLRSKISIKNIYIYFTLQLFEFKKS